MSDYYENMGRPEKVSPTPEEYAAAAKIAETEFELGKEAEHPYLAHKGVKMPTTRVGLNGDLLISVHDLSGKIHSLQRIPANLNKDKMLLKDGRKKGNFHLIGNLPKEEERLNFEGRIAFCEGGATGASISAALENIPVVCAIDVWNLRDVLPLFRTHFPKAVLDIYADNDLWTKNSKGDLWNPGRDVAIELQKQLSGVRVWFPRFKEDDLTGKESSDFNDMQRLYGLSLLKKRLALDNHINMFRPQLLPIDFGGMDAGDFADCVEFEEKPIIKGILNLNGISLTSAATKSGKSVIARQKAVCLARGQDFLGLPTKKSYVIYLAFDEPKGYIQKNLRALFTGPLDPARKDIRIYTPQDFSKAIAEAHRRELKMGNLDVLEKLIKQARKRLIKRGFPEMPIVIMVDVLIKFTPFNETNDYNPSYEIMSRYRAIAEIPHTAIELIHHRKKGDGGGDLDKVMGSASFAAGSDIIVSLDRPSGGVDRFITVEGRTTSPWEEKMKIIWDTEKWWGSLGGTKSSQKKIGQTQDIIDALAGVREETALSQIELLRRAEMDNETFKNIEEKLVEGGFINRKQNPKYKKGYVFWEALDENNPEMDIYGAAKPGDIC